MFKLILFLVWLDPQGQVQQEARQYQLGFATLEACHDHVEETMDQVEVAAENMPDGNRFLGVSYGCVFDPNATPEESA